MRLFGGSRGAGRDLVVTAVWGDAWPNVDVVGESHYATAIQRLVPRYTLDGGQETVQTVTLVREPGNRYDPNAIAVHASTGQVGHLSREVAARYAPVLDALAANGRVASTSARVWGGVTQDWETNRPKFIGSVRIALPEPHLLFPSNLPPTAPHVLLPPGGTIQVTGEENYRDNLAPWLNQHGETWVHATVHEVVEQTPRTTKTLAEVRIDDRPVGRLTPRMSQELLPAIQHLAQRGLATAVQAKVKGNALKADVTLHAARAGDLSQDWLAEVEQKAFVSSTPAAISTSAADPAAEPDQPAGTRPEMQASPTSHAAPAPPADWYPDPYRTARLRWWDGAAWSGHTSD